jgi:hypothetical protein
MATRFLRRSLPRVSQPQFPAPLGSIGQVLTPAHPFTASASVTSGINSLGKFVKPTSGTLSQPLRFTPPANNFTLLIVASAIPSTLYAPIGGAYASLSGASNGLFLKTWDAAGKLLLFGTSGNLQFTDASVINAPVVIVMGVMGSVPYIFVNGKPETITTSLASVTWGSDPALVWANSTAQMGMCALLPGMSAQAAKNLSRMPWTVFADLSLPLPIGAVSPLYPTLSNIRFNPATPTGGYFAVDLS